MSSEVDNGEQLLPGDTAIHLVLTQNSSSICYHPFVTILDLRQNGSNGVVTSIVVEQVRRIVGGHCQHRERRESFLQPLEGRLRLIRPQEGSAFLIVALIGAAISAYPFTNRR